MRQWTRLGDTQVRVHLRRLLDLEYVAVHRGRQGQGYVYELCYAGDEPHLFDASTTTTSRGLSTTSRGDRGTSAGLGARSASANNSDEIAHLAALRGGDDKSRSYSPRTLQNNHSSLKLFVDWCEARGLSKPAQITKREVEQVLLQPDINTPVGLRDRAILEVLYSTGMRRAELSALLVGDIDGERSTVMIRLGKGQRDRYLPIGQRAAAWVDRAGKAVADRFRELVVAKIRRIALKPELYPVLDADLEHKNARESLADVISSIRMLADRWPS